MERGAPLPKDNPSELRIQQYTLASKHRMKMGMHVRAFGLSLMLWVQPLAARAQEPQSARTELWLSLSATMVLGGIAGSFALRSAALDDRMRLLAPGDPESFRLQEDALQARRWLWGFGAGAGLMAVTSLLVWLYQPTAEAPAPDAQPAVNPVLSAHELGVQYRSRF